MNPPSVRPLHAVAAARPVSRREAASAGGSAVTASRRSSPSGHARVHTSATPLPRYVVTVILSLITDPSRRLIYKSGAAVGARRQGMARAPAAGLGAPPRPPWTREDHHRDSGAGDGGSVYVSTFEADQTRRSGPVAFPVHMLHLNDVFNRVTREALPRGHVDLSRHGHGRPRQARAWAGPPLPDGLPRSAGAGSCRRRDGSGPR